MMFAYVSNTGLKLYHTASFAPIWHALTTPDTAVLLNAAAAVVTALCLAFAIPRLLLFGTDRKVRWTPYVLFLAFLVIPPFARNVFDVSPVMFGLLPVALSLVALVLHGERPFDDEDVRPRNFGFGIAVAGALAAVAAWEGTLGVLCLPLLLAATLLPAARKDCSLFSASTSWMTGFAVGFAVEGLCLGFKLAMFKPIFPPLAAAGLIVFVAVCVVPVLVIRTFGESPLTLGCWGVVCLVLGVVSLQGVLGKTESGCEKFVKTVLADLGDRKLVISDGLFDNFLNLYKPEDVRLVGTRTNADREFLLNFFDDGTSVTNKALIVRQYYGIPEMEQAALEMGFRRAKPETLSEAEKEKRRERVLAARRMASQPQVELTEEEVKSNVVSRAWQAAGPVLKTLTDVEAELVKPAGKRDRSVLVRGRDEIRTIWRRGSFRGPRLSNALLMADIMLGDKLALESDAITAMMIDRNDPTANGALGAVRQEQGKFEQAERYLRKGVKGGGVLAFGKLAILLLQTDRPDEAVTWARKAIEKSPNDLSLREPLVASLVESGKLDEAERELGTFKKMVAEQKVQDRERQFLKEVGGRLAELRKKGGAK